jgi:peroxiredoxin
LRGFFAAIPPRVRRPADAESEAAEVYNPIPKNGSGGSGAGGFLAALEPGTVFPQVALETESGARFVPPAAETLYVFFKTTCPTCELAWPYLERIRRIAGDALPVFAVSQDTRPETAEFNERLGVEVGTLYDPPPWSASATLGLTNVPTFFLVGPGGRIRKTVVGFQRPKLEALANRAAKLAGGKSARLFRIGENVPLISPG